MNKEEQVKKIDKSYNDILRFIQEGEYEYAAMVVRTVIEIIVNSYSEFYTPYVQNSDNQDKAPTIWDKIQALDKCEAFPRGQISNLHAMRTVGNIGAHQGTDLEITEIRIKAIVPNVEEEIRNWKAFIQEGHESLLAINKENYDRLIHGDPVENRRKRIISLIVTVIGIGAIVYFTKDQTMEWFINGTHFETKRLWLWYVGYLCFLVLAGYSRHHGTVNKLICDVGMLYYLIPRGYLVYLCLNGKGDFFTLIGNIILCGAIFGSYTFLSVVVAEQQEGYTIRGYK